MLSAEHGQPPQGAESLELPEPFAILSRAPQTAQSRSWIRTTRHGPSILGAFRVG